MSLRNCTNLNMTLHQTHYCRVPKKTFSWKSVSQWSIYGSNDVHPKDGALTKISALQFLTAQNKAAEAQIAAAGSGESEWIDKIVAIYLPPNALWHTQS